jgi:hypothetical protein
MPKGTKEKDLTDPLMLRLRHEEYEFLQQVASEETRKLGRVVGAMTVLRAMVQREMDKRNDEAGVWDD